VTGEATFDELLLGMRQDPRDPASLVVVDSVDSTSRLARKIAQDYLSDEVPLPHAVVLALEQTAGRGRQGRSWVSLRGRGVYATLLRRVEEMGPLQTTPLAVGVALCRVLDALSTVGAALRWPNDLLLGGRKVGGVLIEALSRGGEPLLALISFGVNVRHDADALPAPAATSVWLVADQRPGLGQVARALVRAVSAELDAARPADEVVAEYRRCSAHREGDVIRCRMPGREVEGRYLGIDPRGFLRLEVEGREERIGAGEVME
jgi:BirA family biotin operon repressor/biotin-[acetyl-CoA-carboxylase] ligase